MAYILQYNILAGHGNELLFLGFCDYASSILTGRQSTCGKSPTPRDAYVSV